MAGGIFVSYRRDDSRHAAGRLLDRLRQTYQPHQLFMDVDSVAPGLDFVRVLAEQVAACDVMLVIIGPGWLNACDEGATRRLDNPHDFVRIEVEAALKRDVRVIPVLVDGAHIPPEGSLPEPLRPLARRQSVRLVHERFSADADDLVRALLDVVLPAGTPASLAPAAERPAVRTADHDRAIADYTEAIRLNPSLADPYNGRGAAYLGKRDYDRAITDLNEAIRLNPSLAFAYVNRGVAYERTDNCDRAITDLNEAIRLNPSLADAYDARGAACVKKGDYDRAITDLNEAIRLNPNLVSAYISRANAHYYMQRYDNAIADYDRVFRLDPSLAFAYANRASAYQSKGDRGRAIADYSEAIRLNPSFAYAYNYRGLVFELIGRREEAIADFRRALSINPNIQESNEALRRLGAA